MPPEEHRFIRYLNDRYRVWLTPLGHALLCLALTTACSTPRAVQLDTGHGAPLEYRPPSSIEPVRLDAETFEEALTQLVLHAPLPLPFPRRSGLVRTSYSSHDADSRWQHLMSQSFGGLCEPGQRRADCLSLLDDVMGLNEWDKLGVALALSIDPLKESIAKAVEDTLAPQLFYTVIATGLITWAVLAANPEPVFTKAAAIVSAVLLIYLGMETFLALVDASQELKRATDSATTPKELEQAGQRFAKRVGPEVARVFVLAVTVVVSQGMTGGAALLSSRLSMLPSFSEAAVAGASRVGIKLSNVGQVSAVAVVGGTIVISLPATAVAMAVGNGDAERAAHIGPSSDYRETFFAAHPALRDKVVVHHSVEQQVLKRYPGLFTEAEIHALKNLRGVPKSINPELHLSTIRRAWNDFYRTHPRPTKQEVLDFAGQLDRQFGALFEPPL